LRLTLPLTRVRWVAGEAVQQTTPHDEWVLVTQDCDLAWNSIAGSDSLVELRPVYDRNPPAVWGIRASRLLLDDSGNYITDLEPLVKVEPDVVLKAEHLCRDAPHVPAPRLKTWLGLRYNRPAVPQQYVPLAADLAKRLTKKGHARAESRVRDVFATFSTAEDGTKEFALTAVVLHERVAEDDALLKATRDWLAGVALAVPEQLGLNVDVVALTDEQVSLAFLETGYALDASTVSWPNKTPGPVGDAGR